MSAVPAPPDREFIDFQQEVAGRYSLERELGRGGMGIVFLAREVRLARPVAIKVLPRDLAGARPELRDRFVREAQMAAQLSHPNIVPIHQVDEAGDFVYFVMSYIEGETLGERLRSRGALPPAEAARVLRDVGWALAYAHLRGIVHRDVKPDNILLERGTGRALVTDFGIAGDVATPSTADGGYVRGTIHFLSPEQAAGSAVDGRSDIYSLGVTAYYALTGQLPFDANNAMAVMVAHASRRPRPIMEHAPHVPHRLATAVERCLEKLPERRWESGERFAEAVDAAFEMPKELPAPLRAWLTQGDRSRGARFVVAFYGSLGAAAAVAAGQALVAVGVIAAVGTFIVLPMISSIRQLVRAGFGLDDVRSAVATHVSRKREELEYEASSALALTPRRLWIMSGVSAAVTAVGAIASSILWPSAQIDRLIALGGVIAVSTGVTALLRSAQLGRINWLGSPRLWFWKGKWGERLFRLASTGQKRVAAQGSLPQHTEVALGRALDQLFESLPKATRKELKGVPDTVRRLEEEARKLRESLDALDSAASAAERAGQPDEGRELLAEREAVATRLANSVTALETIRLGLLRLQLGAVQVSSVTEAIEAATMLGREIDIAAEAKAEASAAIKRRD